MAETLLFNALREAIDEEMARDPHVCVMGEDVGHYGGSYKVTKDLYDKYGELRVLDTPIAENAFTGMAVGAAMTGLRPIVEGMNMCGFFFCGVCGFFCGRERPPCCLGRIARRPRSRLPNARR